MKQTDHEAICCLTGRVKELEAENKRLKQEIIDLECGYSTPESGDFPTLSSKEED